VAPSSIIFRIDASTPRTAATSKPFTIEHRRQGVIVTKQLIGTVDEMDFQQYAPALNLLVPITAIMPH